MVNKDNSETPSLNKWSENWVARAFQDQRFAKPYVEMMRVFKSYIDPKPNSEWLDIGCGIGELTLMLLNKANGAIGRIVGMDYNEENRDLFIRHIVQSNPKFAKTVEFQQGDISQGLTYPDQSFDGVTAGLVLSYAESWDSIQDKWDDKAYLNIYREIYRVLKKEGQLVFSINVPNPNFTKIMTASWREILGGGRFFRFMRNGISMLLFSIWLKRCALAGRFHYLPIEKIVDILKKTGFEKVQYELTYASQAWVINCYRPK